MGEVSVEMAGKIGCMGKLADTKLRGDFPSRSSADQDGVRPSTDEFASSGREPRIIGEPPQ